MYKNIRIENQFKGIPKLCEKNKYIFWTKYTIEMHIKTLNLVLSYKIILSSLG